VDARPKRTVWYVVADLTRPTAEPYAVMSVDTAVQCDGGVEGAVVSLHWQRDHAERVAHELNSSCT
jgi:hypothetical protein